MKKTALWGISLLLVAVMAAPGYAQTIPDPKEYDAYANGVYALSKDPAKQAAAAEKFLADYPNTVAKKESYNFMIFGFGQSGNYAKALEKAELLNQFVPTADNAYKTTVYKIGMESARQLRNNPKTIEYAEKLLTLNPTDFDALYILSGTLAGTIPTAAGAPKDAHLKKTLEMTKRTLALPKPPTVADAGWQQTKVQLHHTSCMVLYNQQQYAEAIAACEEALKLDKKYGDSYYLLGLSRLPEYTPLTKKYTDAVNEFNANRDGGQILVAENQARVDATLKAAEDKRDEILDIFAKGAVATGNFTKQSLEQAQKLYKSKNNDSLDGFDQLLQQKKAEIGG